MSDVIGCGFRHLLKRTSHFSNVKLILDKALSIVGGPERFGRHWKKSRDGRIAPRVALGWCGIVWDFVSIKQLPIGSLQTPQDLPQNKEQIVEVDSPSSSVRRGSSR